MIKKLVVLFFFSNCSFLYAQTIKTDVLVIGSNASAFAAAIQSARSKVKTVLSDYDGAGEKKTGGLLSINADRDNPSGIWAEFRKQVRAVYEKTPGYDTAFNAPLALHRDTGAAILKRIADTVKNLTIVNEPFNSIKKDGDRWEVNLLQNGKTQTIKARIIIDATENGNIVLKAGVKFARGQDNIKNGIANLYRTSIACGEFLPGQQNTPGLTTGYPPRPAWCMPMQSVLLPGAGNLLVIAKALPAGGDIQFLPLQLKTGQGAGAIAAYCAFFKTTTNNLRVRIIQGELLDFKSYLLPFSDITSDDRDWRAIQQVCAAGLLKGAQQIKGNDVRFVFKPDSTVNTAEVQPGLKEIYTRAFLWFNKEKPGEKFTVGNLLSFISDYTLTEPDVLRFRAQRDWKTLYAFKNNFDLNRAVTRREFAVLTNKFLNPFARTVDLQGRLVN